MNKDEIQALEDSFAETGIILEALSSKIRQDIILELVKCYPRGLRIGEINKKKCITRPTMSHHMKLLCKANLIGYNKMGTKNYYYLNVDAEKISKLSELFEKLKTVAGEKNETSH